jgi:hypothetical protein
MRNDLWSLVRQVLESEPELTVEQTVPAFQEGNDVAILNVGTDRAVIVTLLTDIAPTDVVRQGVLAHQRMTALGTSRFQCLLVLPGLELSAPAVLTPRVVITNTSIDHIRASLVQMVTR